MLTLIIKKKWFDMIQAGIKKEEYREIKPYYTIRFIRWLGFPKHAKADNFIEWFKYNLEKDGTPDKFKRRICFRNGYQHDAPELICECGLHIGTGREEWGAEPNKKYFVLEIKNIL